MSHDYSYAANLATAHDRFEIHSQPFRGSPAETAAVRRKLFALGELEL